VLRTLDTLAGSTMPRRQPATSNQQQIVTTTTDNHQPI
jgi:hypothetical protein